MNTFFEALKAHIEQNPPNYGDGESILETRYECYSENSPYNNEQIRADFNELYQLPLREMDKIIYPVCTLCRDHERAGFVEGIKAGVRMWQERSEE